MKMTRREFLLASLFTSITALCKGLTTLTQSPRLQQDLKGTPGPTPTISIEHHWTPVPGSTPAYTTHPVDENMIQWRLDDHDANTTVVGEVNGILAGGNTADVQETVHGYPAFHLNGTDQFVSIAVPKIWPSAISNLWTKYPGNPVIGGNVSFGHLTRNPAGGWFFFGSSDETNIDRWESADLITWSNRIQVLPGALGHWDEHVEVALVFQKPDHTWIMLYRGYNHTRASIGLATSRDGTTFLRKNNGGFNDGLFPQFGSNYDATGVILVEKTYYVYVNGDPHHGVSNIYYSVDDFNTFKPAANNPIFKGANSAFCATVWRSGEYFYALAPRDYELGKVLYYHGIGLYRSTSPTFEVGSTIFLGYAIVNDQKYDRGYLDTPSVPTSDIYQDTIAPEFGSKLYMMYCGRTAPERTYLQNLAYTNINSIASLKQRVDQIYGTPVSFSFWVQFDTLNDGDPIFSVGNKVGDANPQWSAKITASSADKVLSLWFGGEFMNTALPLAVNTPYHIVIVENTVDRKVYINQNLIGTYTQENNGNHDTIYLGAGADKSRFLDGFIWDFRIYPKDLAAAEIAHLYLTGSIEE